MWLSLNVRYLPHGKSTTSSPSLHPSLHHVLNPLKLFPLLPSPSFIFSVQGSRKIPILKVVRPPPPYLSPSCLSIFRNFVWSESLLYLFVFGVSCKLQWERSEQKHLCLTLDIGYRKWNPKARFLYRRSFYLTLESVLSFPHFLESKRISPDHF